MHRVSSPWLKLLSAVGVIPTLITMMKGGSPPLSTQEAYNLQLLTRCTPAADHSEKPSIGGGEGRVCTA